MPGRLENRKKTIINNYKKNNYNKKNNYKQLQLLNFFLKKLKLFLKKQKKNYYKKPL